MNELCICRFLIIFLYICSIVDKMRERKWSTIRHQQWTCTILDFKIPKTSSGFHNFAPSMR